jgi:beta-lactamase regulating signal transducer with metallopeptidase domain
MDAALNWLWQGSVVAVALPVMLRLLDRARANVRYVVCWAALLLVAVLPVISWLTAGASASAAATSTAGDAIVTLPDGWWTSSESMLVAWTAWAGIYAVRFLWSILVLRRTRTRSHPFPSQAESALPHWRGVRFEGRRAVLVVSDSVRTAAVLGGGPPVIAVSSSLIKTLDAGELDRVLLHEWAHVQRRDDLANLLQIGVRIVAGWHPAVWWIDRCLHVEREIACDEMVVAITGAPKAYATCLLKVASLRKPGRTVLIAAAVLTASGLRARVTKIVSPSRSIAPLWARGLAAAIVSTLCVVSVSVGGLRLVEATAFVLPLEPVRMVSTTLDRLAPLAAPTLPSRRVKEGSPRQAAGPAPSQGRPTVEEPSASTPPMPDAEAPLAPDPSYGEPAPSAADGGTDRTAASETPPVPDAARPQPPAATGEQPRSPWAAVAQGGTALGRKSKDASVAAAGFFTRFARRVGGSF